jgi:hypothetical protein
MFSRLLALFLGARACLACMVVVFIIHDSRVQGLRHHIVLWMYGYQRVLGGWVGGFVVSLFYECLAACSFVGCMSLLAQHVRWWHS